jgi:hypothetical protein
MSNVSQINALLYGIQFSDPRLYEVLRLLANEIDIVNRELFPIVIPSVTQTAPREPVFVTPLGTVTYTLYSTYIRLSWDKPGNDAFSYEVRLGGADWAHADRQTITQSTSVNLPPTLVGTQLFRFKVINSEGDYSTETTCSIIIPPVGAVTITSSVVDNNVLLYWTAPTSIFQIDHYNIYRNSVLFGTINSTFAAIFETAAGTYTYKVVAVDIAGNIGADASISVVVSQPPDYIFIDEIAADFVTNAATKVNVYVGGGRLLACVNPALTWDQHFAGHGYATIQDQLTAGYPLYIQPTETTGSYIEKVDFGIIISNVLATVDYNYRNIAGSIATTISIEYSNDDSTWSGYVVGGQQFILSMRYLRVKFEFAGDADELLEITNLKYRLDVRQTTESGSISALATDATGTVVNFTIAFRDINSITLTANSVEPIICIYDFVDVPNPTSFKILAFDTSGNRVTKTVSWQAKGIV